MREQKVIIESLAMDLKRVALGSYRGSFIMTNRFKEEALKRGEELEQQQPNDYLIKIWKMAKTALLQKSDRIAEDALMYSVLFQNFALKN